jgi:hypothetical protein
LPIRLPAGRNLDLSAGIEGLLLFGLNSPTWNKTLGIYGAKDGFATFPNARLAGSITAVIMPGLGARYDF